ncbi:MAG: hypothetical protein KAH91_00400 [Thermoplasmatales archaeon]|nr:hypothetical protein [Thermoplasmatales archaeon]MCK5635851.1 hypothetical protein [Thermoplasmatales archaeon]
MNEESELEGESKEDNFFMKISKYFQSNRRLKLKWERLWFNNEWIFYVYYLIFTIMIALIVVSVVQFIGSNEDNDSALAWLIPLILAFQLLFIITQTVNQKRHNKIMKMGVVPSLSVYMDELDKITSRGHKVGKYWGMVLLNLGTDAHNVRYAIKEDGEYIKSDIPYFLLRRDKAKEINKYHSESDYIDKKIEVYVVFEDMIRSPRYEAYFKKDAKEKEFRTVSTGIR